MQAISEGPHWMLRLDPGEELLEGLGRFAADRGIQAAAVVMGIGTVRSATLGYWNGREYDKKQIDQPTELVSLGGSVAHEDGRPSVHLHATLGTQAHGALSGHLHAATVHILAELVVEAFPSHAFGRPLDESAGLRILDLGAGPHSP